MAAAEPAGDSRGILHPRAGEAAFSLARHRPSDALAPFVAYLWTVEWDLPAGRSRVVGVRFRAGGARPWLDGPVSRLAERQLPVTALVDIDADPVRAAVRDAPDTAAAAAAVDAALVPLGPQPDPAIDRAEELLGWIAAEPGIRRVEQLAERAGTTVRSLQRFCAEWIGLGPKDLIRWARLHEAAGRAAQGPVDWAALAVELGYADQAHLVRDFTRVVGDPPARYARAEAATG